MALGRLAVPLSTLEVSSVCLALVSAGFALTSIFTISVDILMGCACKLMLAKTNSPASKVLNVLISL